MRPFVSFCQCARQKANELEDYQTVSVAGTHLEGDDEPAVKKRKMAKEVSFLPFPLCLSSRVLWASASANQKTANNILRVKPEELLLWFAHKRKCSSRVKDKQVDCAGNLQHE